MNFVLEHHQYIHQVSDPRKTTGNIKKYIISILFISCVDRGLEDKRSARVDMDLMGS
jgi:hypothetical protein